MPKISVIINCYNGAEFLAETLDALRAQTFTDYEVVFWDNCSTDATPEIAHTFDERLRYFRGETLIPLGEARNKALAQARGTYIAFLDSDDIWAPEKLELQVRVLDETPTCGMVFSNYNLMNMLSGKTKPFFPPSEDRTLRFQEFVCNYSYCLSTFLIRREALEQLNHWFDNRLKYAEEYELFVRIAYRWDARYLSKTLVSYRIHPRMNTLQLQERMAQEYEITLDQLRSMVDGFDEAYPDIVRRIHYLRDFSTAKFLLPQGDNARVRVLMKPYWDYNIRAKCYYLAACAPRPISKWVFSVFYRKRI